MGEIRSKKELEIKLSKLKGFEEGKVSAEQYTTPSDIGGEILWNGYMKGHIEGKVIVDLGSGTGVLGIGCLLLGASKVYFIESESSAIEIFKENLENLKKSGSEFKGEVILEKMDVSDFNLRVDTCVMNPPFGTKRKHMDKIFLEKALSLANLTYSFHKTSTLEYIIGVGEKLGKKLIERFDFRYLLKRSMKHHTKDKQYIEVSCVLFG